MHRAKEIMDAITTMVTDLPTTGSNVSQSRIYKKNSLPMLAVMMEGIKTNVVQGIVSDASLTISIDIYVEGSEDQLDDQLLQIHSEVHSSIMAMPKLNLSYVIDTVATGLDAPEVNVGTKAVAVSSAKFEIKFRHDTDSWEV